MQQKLEIIKKIEKGKSASRLFSEWIIGDKLLETFKKSKASY